MRVFFAVQPSTEEVGAYAHDHVSCIKTVVRHGSFAKAIGIGADDACIGNCVNFNEFSSRIFCFKLLDHPQFRGAINGTGNNSDLLAIGSSSLQVPDYLRV